MHNTLVWGPFYQFWWPQGTSKEFNLWLTLADLCMTFDSSNALRSGHGFFPPNLVAIGHCWANWPLLDPSWPLHDLWPQQCIMFWSGILLTKFGGHRALLSNLTPGWPRMTPAWPLTPAMHYALVRGSSHKIWWPKDIARQIDPYLTPADLYMTFDPNNAVRSGQGFFPPNLVAIGHLLSNLTPTWPQLTPIWPLTPAMYYSLVSDSFHQIWWP